MRIGVESLPREHGVHLGTEEGIREASPRFAADDPVPSEDLSLDRLEHEDRFAGEILEHHRHDDHILVAQRCGSLDRVPGLHPVVHLRP